MKEDPRMILTYFEIVYNIGTCNFSNDWWIRRTKRIEKDFEIIKELLAERNAHSRTIELQVASNKGPEMPVPSPPPLEEEVEGNMMFTFTGKPAFARVESSSKSVDPKRVGGGSIIIPKFDVQENETGIMVVCLQNAIHFPLTQFVFSFFDNIMHRTP